jgi:queuine tRNA-ribosyltransferase
VAEPTASRLVSVHNVAWTLRLLEQMRTAIVARTFQDLRRSILTIWG